MAVSLGRRAVVLAACLFAARVAVLRFGVGGGTLVPTLPALSGPVTPAPLGADEAAEAAAAVAAAGTLPFGDLMGSEGASISSFSSTLSLLAEGDQLPTTLDVEAMDAFMAREAAVGETGSWEPKAALSSSSSRSSGRDKARRAPSRAVGRILEKIRGKRRGKEISAESVGSASDAGGAEGEDGGLLDFVSGIASGVGAQAAGGAVVGAAGRSGSVASPGSATSRVGCSVANKRGCTGLTTLATVDLPGSRGGRGGGGVDGGGGPFAALDFGGGSARFGDSGGIGGGGSSYLGEDESCAAERRTHGAQWSHARDTWYQARTVAHSPGDKKHLPPLWPVSSVATGPDFTCADTIAAEMRSEKHKVGSCVPPLTPAFLFPW